MYISPHRGQQRRRQLPRRCDERADVRVTSTSTHHSYTSRESVETARCLYRFLQSVSTVRCWLVPSNEHGSHDIRVRSMHSLWPRHFLRYVIFTHVGHIAKVRLDGLLV